jgi:ABC-type glycerol-3-phosphate transport system substrate-binding protein
MFFIGLAKRRRISWSVTLAIALLALGACGGGSDDTGSSQSKGGQPAAYTVTVTASGAMALSHTQQFTLNVSG